MRALELPLLNGALVGTLFSAWRRFSRALARPERTQQALLSELVRRNRGSAFGREHGFEQIRSVAEFRRRVPVRDYEAFAPYVARIARGESRVLTEEPVRMLERTSGSSSTNKLIPYTSRLLGEFSSATGPLLFDLYRRKPGLLRGSSYWSVSPVTRKREYTQGGLAIGFEDDSEYFSPLERWALSRLMSVPKGVAQLSDIEQWRFATCRHLLADGHLGLLSVWSPTFLTILMETLEQRLPELLSAVPRARAHEVQRGLDRAGMLSGKALWPRLCAISCWSDGPSADFVPALAAYFPGVAIEPKGLLATEGVVSFAFGEHQASALAVTSHFLEFIDLEAPDGEPRLAHELRAGGRYSPLVSTGGGLYRYHLKDVVECVGHVGRVPRIRFVEKLERTSDLCGEKLHASVVREAIDSARGALGLSHRFAMVAPVKADKHVHYRLYVESDADERALAQLSVHVEQSLRKSHHYDYCRTLGQLGALDVARVTRAAHVYERTMRERGLRAGDIKPTCLDGDAAWDARFGHAEATESTQP
jgi:hypothetical protein